MNTFKSAALLVAATALVAGSSVAATAAPDPDGTRVTSLQQTAERVLGGDAKPVRVTADAVRYDGLTVTEAPKGKANTKALSCGYGHLCMIVNGTKFDSSVDRHQPFEFSLGAGQVIAGWDQGVEGMKVGEKR